MEKWFENEIFFQLIAKKQIKLKFKGRTLTIKHDKSICNL